MQIIRNASFTATPWKNGGGVTHEAIRVPGDGKAFRWRVSVAQIGVAGPFSDFAGYHRIMVLLRGNGVHLRFAGGRQASLRNVGDLAEFDGAVATECELLDGPCTDLNLMVSQSIAGVKAWVERLRGSWSPMPASGATATYLIFGISGALSLQLGSGEPVHLDPWDLAVLRPAENAVLEPAGSAGDFSPSAPSLGDSPAPLVFFATLDDNST